MNSTPELPPQFKLAYVSGPVDARAIHADALAAREPQYFGTSYLAQLFRLVREHGGRSVVVTTLPDLDYDETIGSDRVTNIAPPVGLDGLRFHIAMIGWGIRVLRLLFRERPDAVVLTASQNYFFVLAPLRLTGAAIIVSLHCTLWPKFGHVPASWIWLRRLNKRLLFRHAAAIQCVSSDIRDQVVKTLPSAADRISVFRPTYDPRQFADVRPPDFASRAPFRIVFVGRIEANKGPFDLLAAARHLRARPDMPPFRVDFCGEGSDLLALKASVNERDFGDTCFVHGVCAADKVRTLYGESHIVVVPTRSDFEEGYNKVCAEAVLAGRPVVTSAACPALSDVRDAAIEVGVDDVDGYADAIFLLATDRAVYEDKVRAARSLRMQYFDAGNSYAAHLGATLRKLGLIRNQKSVSDRGRQSA